MWLDRIKEAIDVCLEAEKIEIHPMKFVGVQRVEVMAFWQGYADFLRNWAFKGFIKKAVM